MGCLRAAQDELLEQHFEGVKPSTLSPVGVHVGIALRLQGGAEAPEVDEGNELP